MATPKGFGNRIHFDNDGCDPDSIRHSMYFQEQKLTGQVFGPARRVPTMGSCPKCGDPVMEEEFDCGKHGDRK